MSRRRVSRNRRSTSTLSGNPSQSTHQTPRENATKTCVSRDEKSHAHILMPKPSKKLFKQTPFLVKVLLFLAKFGVNINRPPPPLRAIALFVSAFTLVLLLTFTRRNASFFTLNGEKPDRRAIRCARTFPQVASHQLLTAQPRVTSGGKDALDYLRDGFEVKNYDIDAVQLKDGALLAAHPQRLFDRIQKDAKEVTLKEARALGADERSFVSLKDLIEHFATSTVLQRKTGSSSPVGWKGVSRKTTWLAQEFGKNVGGMSSNAKRPVGIDGMFFGVDLKGDALNVENVVLVNEYAKKANVVDAVSYYVTDPESDASKNIQKALESSFPKSEDRIKTTWALRDVDASHWETEKFTKENLERMKIHGLLPSAKFDESWYSKVVKESNAWVESWVADDLETALELRKKGAHAMITNVPESLIEGIKQFCMNGENFDKAIAALAKMRT
ncbi:unnamed protein product [Bathycoccus prasinos]